MDRKKYLLAFLLGMVFFTGYAQEKVTLSGYVREASSGEELVGATVAIQELGIGTASNIYGFYSITLPAGEYDVKYSYIGFQDKQLSIMLTADRKMDIELLTADIALEEVVVTTDKPDENVSNIKMSRENLKIEKIKSIPALFGEVDILRTIQFLPGVQSAGEGTTGLFVRGGSADQNLIQLDEATVYNASHFLGFFSVFNPDAIKNVEIYKGGIPAKFGGRASSILDIQMREGNNKKFSMSGGVGLISSRLTVEGPFVKDKASYMISGRRTYADLFLRLSPDESINRNVLYFYDLNAKANWKINENNRIFLSGYFGRDVFRFDNVFGINWGNATTTLRWNHLFSDKLFMNSTFLFSNYDYGFDLDFSETQNFKWRSNLQEYSAKFDFDYFLNPQNTITFGSNTIFHTFQPAEVKGDENSIIDPIKLDNRYAIEQAFYVGNEQKLTDWLSMQYGLRYSFFQNVGPGEVRVYEEGAPRLEENVIDTISYSTLEGIRFYHGLEPRFAARAMLGSSSSVKASYNRMRQYLQIASNATAGTPIDRWIPADTYIEPIIADQIALGYFRNFFDNSFEVSVEVYYKWLQNIIDFKPEADILLNENIETEVYAGMGRAYGVEFMLKKNIGKATGWLSYTLSRTTRQIEEINGGKPYKARYDRPHDVTLVFSYQLTDRMLLASNWVYATGSAVSLPIGRYISDGQSVALYDDLNRNAGRMPPYHRMDLSFTYDFKSKKRWKSSLNVSIYNVYARKNAFTIEFSDIINDDPNYDAAEDGQEISRRPASIKTYLFSIVPSVTYNFKF